MTEMTQPRWFVGVEWGSRTHDACVLDGAGAVRDERAFKHGGGRRGDRRAGRWRAC